MNISRETIKRKLFAERWSIKCQRLVDFIERVKYDYGLDEVDFDDITIVETSDPHYLDRRNRRYSSAAVLKKGNCQHGSYWTYVLFRWKKEFPPKNN